MRTGYRFGGALLALLVYIGSASALIDFSARSISRDEAADAAVGYLMPLTKGSPGQLETVLTERGVEGGQRDAVVRVLRAASAEYFMRHAASQAATKKYNEAPYFTERRTYATTYAARNPFTGTVYWNRTRTEIEQRGGEMVGGTILDAFKSEATLRQERDNFQKEMFRAQDRLRSLSLETMSVIEKETGDPQVLKKLEHPNVREGQCYGGGCPL